MQKISPVATVLPRWVRQAAEALNALIDRNKLRVGDVAASYTFDTETMIRVTDTAAPRTIALPDKALVGVIYRVVDASGGAGTNNITVSAQGSQMVDGAVSVTISSNYGGVSLIFDGANWWTN